MHSKNRKKNVIGCCIFFTAVFTATAFAQDIGGIFRSVLNSRTTDLMNLVIKSATDTTFGRIAQGVQGPADADGKVVLYRTSWCGYCKMAASYMQRKNIPFAERDIEANPSYKSEYARVGGKGPVPLIVFGNKTLQGFSESAFDSYYADFQKSQPNAQAIPEKNPNGAAGINGLQSGDTLSGKIPGIQVYAQPNKLSSKLGSLAKTDSVVYMGEERDGFYRITASHGEGWVDKLLVKKN